MCIILYMYIHAVRQKISQLFEFLLEEVETCLEMLDMFGTIPASVHEYS